MDEKVVKLDNYSYSRTIPDKEIEKYHQYPELVNYITDPQYKLDIMNGLSAYEAKQQELKNNITNQKIKTFTNKAGFMDTGMFVDLLIVSVAIILLILIIIGTRY